MDRPDAHTPPTPLRQAWHFIVHLRWHYQVGILSGGYLLGGVLAETMNWETWLLQFLNVHLLLFGGATAYNSYWDRDEGPVGGLRRPPPMNYWMLPASLVLQYGGLLLAWWLSGLAFAGVYAASMLFFWLYSTPHARWKGAPLKSLAAIGISTGTNSFLMGYLAASPWNFNGWVEVPAALGACLVILSLYPASQVYQQEEDRERGDRTFALRFGRKGVLNFFGLAWLAGVLLLVWAFWMAWLPYFPVWAVLLLVTAALVMEMAIRRVMKKRLYQPEGYRTIMLIKYGASAFFVILLSVALIARHGWPDL